MSGRLVLGLLDRVPAPGRSVESTGVLDDERLLAVLGAGRIAPSADNAQTWRFVTVRSEAMRARLGQAAFDRASGDQLAASHTVVVLCGIATMVTRTRREQPFVFMDVPIALTHMIFQATELGLAYCWTLDVDETGVRSALSIPESVRVLALLGLS